MSFSAIASAVGGSLVSGLFSAKQASDNRDFQEDMSNTSYRRAVKDMRKAGLNPILAAGRLGGASTPSGAMASIPDLGATYNSARSVEADTSLKAVQEVLSEQLIPGAKAIAKVAGAALQLVDSIDKQLGGMNNAVDEFVNRAADYLKGLTGKLEEAGVSVKKVDAMLKKVQNFIDTGEKKLLEEIKSTYHQLMGDSENNEILIDRGAN